MKKFLLTAVCALGLGFMANAETITLNVNDATNFKGEYIDTKYKDDGSVQEWGHWQPLESLTIGDYTFSFAGSEDGKYNPAYYTAKEGGQFTIRLYTDCSITVSAPAGTTMGNILINGSNGSDGCFSGATPGSATYASNKITWGSTAGESSVTFSFAKSYRINSLEITTGAGTAVDPEPTPDPEAVTVKNVKEILALESKTKIVTDFALTVGFVNKSNVFVCDPAGDFIQIYGSNTLSIGDVIPAGLTATYELYNEVTPELTGATIPAATAGTFTPATVAPSAISNDLVNSVVLIKNVVLAEASPAAKENFTGTADGVELSFRNNYSLASVAAGTYNITVVVTIYNGEPSLYVTNFENVNGETPEPTPDPEPEPTEVTAKSVKEIIALENKTPVITDFALTVGWVFGKNIFVCDPAGDFIQIYNENTLSVGDVIPAGLKATYELYNGTTPELTGATIPAATAGTFTPAVVAPADITTDLVNSVVLVKNVVLAEASPAAKENFTATADGVELSFRNNYSLESVPAGTYDITIVVTVYQGAPSLYVTNYAEAAGIEAIEADNNAPVEFFNLQGVRVANPDNGLYIRRQGDKVAKVYVK